MVLVVEHESTRGGRWLRRNRLRLALWIAVAEGALVLFDVIPGWTAFVVAAALIAFYLLVGRRSRLDVVRHASWTAAVSQVLIALIPVLVALLTFAAFAVLAILVLVAVALLFFDRR